MSRSSTVLAPFVVPVAYVLPTSEEFARRFPIYAGLHRDSYKFKPIDRCRDVSRENREIEFEYVHMGRNASTDKVLSRMDRRGLRPALYEELLAFALKFPYEQQKHPIVALGSVALVDGFHVVASLWSDRNGRDLFLVMLGGSWRGSYSYRFLAVKK